jgi:hypothetical protein
MGLLKDVLQRRPDMKMVVMSATLDAEKFQKYFGDVSGRGGGGGGGGFEDRNGRSRWRSSYLYARLTLRWVAALSHSLFGRGTGPAASSAWAYVQGGSVLHAGTRTRLRAGSDSNGTPGMGGEREGGREGRRGKRGATTRFPQQHSFRGGLPSRDMHRRLKLWAN